MPQSAAIDTVTLQMTRAALQHDSNEANRLSLAQITAEAADRSLDEICDDLRRSYRERPGEFGLEYASALLLPVVLPAIHAALKRFVGAMLEGAAEEAGKLTVESIRGAIAAKPPSTQLKPELLAEIERELAQRARELQLPSSSYAAVLETLRRNPRLLL